MYEALSDYMRTILCGWYRFLNGWTPESVGDSSACADCAASPFRDHETISAWPHGVVHPLLVSLDQASDQVTEYVSELLLSGGSGRHAAKTTVGARGRAIERYSTGVIRAELTANGSDIAEVLQHCVAPGLDDYVRSQTHRAIAYFEAA